mmetsp:Transcript_11699/g.31525  ORF Transcript_11699/g.31525 Transcript_11699/m.31525 type:complete len:571 (-) Transcript_11699:88-1800(-)
MAGANTVIVLLLGHVLIARTHAANFRGSLSGVSLVDKNASKETLDLYDALISILMGTNDTGTQQHITATMFGHQDDLAYGFNFPYVKNGAIADPPDSDVFLATDRQFYPKLFGFDIGNIYNPDGLNVDMLYKGDIARWIRKAHSMGGVITLSMHNDNPLTGKSAWDNTTGTVASILPGGVMHEEWMGRLGKLADFVESLAPIPILFRPYHEANHVWSWWGAGACTREEFVQLWRMTVDFFLQRETWTRNALFVISPQDPTKVGSGDLDDLDEYFSRYPGDDYVDVLGFDGYELWHTAGSRTTGQTLMKVIEYSTTTLRSRGQLKPVALTEAGTMYYNPAQLSAGVVPTYGPHFWWTQNLNLAIQETSYRLGYALVWRNPYRSWDCYVPARVPSEVGVGNICEWTDFHMFLNVTGVGATSARSLVQFLPYTATPATPAPASSPTPSPTPSSTPSPAPSPTPSPSLPNQECCYSGSCASPGICNAPSNWCSRSSANCASCKGFLCDVSPGHTGGPTTATPKPTPGEADGGAACCYSGSCAAPGVCNELGTWCSEGPGNCQTCGGFLCQGATL